MSETLAPVLSNFDRIGGALVVARLVDAFYRRMDTLAETRGIRAMHKADLTGTKDVLRRYLGEWLGGRPLYSRERGHPRLRMRHDGLGIGPDERDAWMLCMTGALDEVVADAALRKLLPQAFLKLATWIAVGAENSHGPR